MLFSLSLVFGRTDHETAVGMYGVDIGSKFDREAAEGVALPIAPRIDPDSPTPALCGQRTSPHSSPRIIPDPSRRPLVTRYLALDSVFIPCQLSKSAARVL